MTYWEGMRTVFQGCCKIDQSTHYFIKIDKAVLGLAVPIGPAPSSLMPKTKAIRVCLSCQPSFVNEQIML